jgi:hypothetical protein
LIDHTLCLKLSDVKLGHNLGGCLKPCQTVKTLKFIPYHI